MAQSSVHVEEATAVTDELVEAFKRLIPQLSRSNPPPTAEELEAIINSEASILLIARDGGDSSEGDSGAGGQILGSLTLAMFLIPTGRRAWIEDVVVDDAARGKGVGRLLNDVAIEKAKAAGARTVDLTSRPSRVAANRLYQRIGFEQRETNVYRYNLT